MQTILDTQDGAVTRAARMARFQRMSRLARLARLLRLVKVVPLMIKSATLRRLKSTRVARIINFVVCLVWAVHLLACGWYLCAHVHEDYSITWLARRILPDGHSLLEEGPLIHWANSMYFVLTVFTTVGFGDISAQTIGEIVYVCITMLVGTILNSIIMSEMINIITSIDQAAADIAKQKELIRAFAEHADLDDDTVLMIQKLMDNSRVVRPQFDREEMNKILTGGLLPQALMAQLPARVYGGRLLCNKFIGLLSTTPSRLPPRFPLLLALMLVQQHFTEAEMVYHCHEHPLNMYLVLDGTFACVARPSGDGGVVEPPPMVVSAVAEFARGPVAARMSRSGSKISGLSSRWRVHRRPTPDKVGSHSRVDVPIRRLYPYKLISARSYFGDVELIEIGPRRCTVRCESPKATVLVLHKQDFNMMMDDFPQYGHMWRQAIIRKEAMRRALLCDLTLGMTYRTLAVVTIQRMVRQKCLKSGSKASTQDSSTRISFRNSKGVDIARSPTSSNTKSKMVSLDSSCSARSSVLSSAEMAPLSACDPANVQTLGALCKEVRHVRNGQDALRREVELMHSKLVQVQSTLGWLTLRDGVEDEPVQPRESIKSGVGLTSK